MENLKEKFIEEAQEHIEDIEQSLLQLETNPNNIELIERIFRAMHTLKGAGAMFGYTYISEITHNIETIYDLIRNGHLKLSKKIVDTTLATSDHIKALLKENAFDDKDVQNTHNELIASINNIVGCKTKQSLSNKIEQLEDCLDEYKTYYIFFKPYADIFDNGTNPLYLIDELENLGKIICYPYCKDIPELDKLDVYKCYTYWEIILATKENQESINDVFIFVEDNCELDIIKISDQNLLDNKKFTKRLESTFSKDKLFGVDSIKEIIEDIEKSVASKVKKAIGINGDPLLKEYTISSIRVSSEKLDNLMNLVSELVTTQARLSLFAENDESPELTNISENVQKLTRQLRDIAFEIVLVPIETLMTRFQRLVRDLAKDLNKEIVFQAKGVETELDKTIIENLTDPLMHIIRNAVDHGIESKSERKKQGKTEHGNIILYAYHSSTNVHIEIIDDGKGINTENIKTHAIEKGLITSETNLTDKQIYDLLFLPGFSTSENVTDVSGRGVGMDVVKQKINSIRGDVEIESEYGKGTKITLIIPLTLSIIDGLLIIVGKTHFLIPLSVIVKIYSIKHNELINSYNNNIVLDHENISYFYLREELNIESNPPETIEQIIVVNYNENKVGLVIDDIVGEYQAVLKPMGKHYSNNKIVSSATILGDGTIALVFDTYKAINYFITKKIIQEDKT